MKRRKNVSSIYFKLKFRPDERRVDVKQKGRKLVRNKKEASVRRGTTTDDRAKILMRFVKQSRHSQIRYSEGKRFGRAGDNRKRGAFSSFKFQMDG